ncbi:hypothetical protein M7I_1389 [Glarea lozoyensis 74030]|uniref:Uncharacterized protein n=1 Tax=Glarea lozoyensis (strain ATCC 74030 / MF5533) TaxID=1104152 RepID=H0EFY1_GLAL7|nr:hypothetical protein M7I_1389 [Glarea lozoyensis 74030]
MELKKKLLVMCMFSVGVFRSNSRDNLRLYACRSRFARIDIPEIVRYTEPPESAFASNTVQGYSIPIWVCPPIHSNTIVGEA